MYRCSILGGIGLLGVIAAVVSVLAQSAGAADPQWPHAAFGQSTHAAARSGPAQFPGARVIVPRLTGVNATYVDNAPTGTSVGDAIAGEGTLTARPMAI